MRFILRKLRIHSLRTSLTVRRTECQTLARQFDTPNSSDAQQDFIKARWGNLMQEVRTLQIELDRIIAENGLS
jgi:hypothetical protein